MSPQIIRDRRLGSGSRPFLLTVPKAGSHGKAAPLTPLPFRPGRSSQAARFTNGKPWVEAPKPNAGTRQEPRPGKIGLFYNRDDSAARRSVVKTPAGGPGGGGSGFGRRKTAFGGVVVHCVGIIL